MPTLSVTVVVSLVGRDPENSGLSVTKRLTAVVSHHRRQHGSTLINSGDASSPLLTFYCYEGSLPKGEQPNRNSRELCDLSE